MSDEPETHLLSPHPMIREEQPKYEGDTHVWAYGLSGWDDQFSVIGWEWTKRRARNAMSRWLVKKAQTYLDAAEKL